MFSAARLKEERSRLGFTQQQLADTAGISKKSQTNYELGHREPDASYLASIGEAGADVLYILTGKPALGGSPAEIELVARFRAASPQLQSAALAVLGVASAGTGAPQVSGDAHGQVSLGNDDSPARPSMSAAQKRYRSDALRR
ncbi:helix-turn-helix transcriptional regulator [Luteimonas sp. gir]|uniref:helix-turn-helix domain-containing protein n=1 Tax=Luteimonas sp. gir TaxID=3127960 RepID=UPI003075CD6B